ncbi:hypothetical protein KIPB_008495, partial [Kipferlia bialata]
AHLSVTEGSDIVGDVDVTGDVAIVGDTSLTGFTTLVGSLSVTKGDTTVDVTEAGVDTVGDLSVTSGDVTLTLTDTAGVAVVGDTSLTAGTNTVTLTDTDGLDVSANVIKGTTGATSVEMVTGGVTLVGPATSLTTTLTATSTSGDSVLSVSDAGVALTTINDFPVTLTGSDAVMELNSDVSIDPASGANVNIGTAGPVTALTIGSTDTDVLAVVAKTLSMAIDSTTLVVGATSSVLTTPTASVVTDVSTLDMDAAGVTVTTSADVEVNATQDIALNAGEGRTINVGATSSLAQEVVAGSSNAATTVSLTGGAANVLIEDAGTTVTGDTTFLDDVAMETTLTVTGLTTLDDSITFTGGDNAQRTIKVAEQETGAGQDLTIVAGAAQTLSSHTGGDLLLNAGPSGTGGGDDGVVLLGGETTLEVRLGADVSVLDNDNAFSIAGPTAGTLSVNARDVSLDASRNVHVNAGPSDQIYIGTENVQIVTVGSTDIETEVYQKGGAYVTTVDASGIELSGVSSSLKFTDSSLLLSADATLHTQNIDSILSDGTLTLGTSDSNLAVDAPTTFTDTVNFETSVTVETSLFFDSSEDSQILPQEKIDADGSSLTISGGPSINTLSTGGDLKLQGGSGTSTSGNVSIGQAVTKNVLIGSAGLTALTAEASQVSVTSGAGGMTVNSSDGDLTVKNDSQDILVASGTSVSLGESGSTETLTVSGDDVSVNADTVTKLGVGAIDVVSITHPAANTVLSVTELTYTDASLVLSTDSVFQARTIDSVDADLTIGADASTRLDVQATPTFATDVTMEQSLVFDYSGSASPVPAQILPKGTVDVDGTLLTVSAGDSTNQTGGALKLVAGAGGIADGAIIIGSDLASKVTVGSVNSPLVEVDAIGVTMTSGADGMTLDSDGATMTLKTDTHTALSTVGTTLALGDSSTSTLDITGSDISIDTDASVELKATDGTDTSTVTVTPGLVAVASKDTTVTGDGVTVTANTVSVTADITAKFDADNVVAIGDGAVSITSAAATITSDLATVRDSTDASKIVVTADAVTVDVAAGKDIKIGTDSVAQVMTVGNTETASTVTLTTGGSVVAMTNTDVTVTADKTTIGNVEIVGNTIAGLTTNTDTENDLYVAAGPAADGLAVGGDLYIDGGAAGSAAGDVLIGTVSTTDIKLGTNTEIVGDINLSQIGPSVISNSGIMGYDLTLEAGTPVDPADASGNLILKAGTATVAGKVQVHSDIEFESSTDRVISVADGSSSSLTIAGSANGGGVAGSVTIVGGDGGAGTDGDVMIGSSNTSNIKIGPTGRELTVTSTGAVTVEETLSVTGLSTLPTLGGSTVTVGEGAGFDFVSAGGSFSMLGADCTSGVCGGIAISGGDSSVAGTESGSVTIDAGAAATGTVGTVDIGLNSSMVNLGSTDVDAEITVETYVQVPEVQAETTDLILTTMADKTVVLGNASATLPVQARGGKMLLGESDSTGYVMELQSRDDASGAQLSILGQSTSNTGSSGGDVLVAAGDATDGVTTGGSVKIRGGDGTTPGDVYIGEEFTTTVQIGAKMLLTDSANLSMTADPVDSGNGSAMTFTGQSTSASGATAGDFVLNAGSATDGTNGTGGSVEISAGTGVTQDGSVSVTGKTISLTGDDITVT